MRLSKLFGPVQPAPHCATHPDDRDLVRQQDVEWWNGLSLKECQSLQKEDDRSRLGAFRKLTETGGLSYSAAGEKVRRVFPTYYLNLEQRADEKFMLGASDAKLPYALRDRVNRALKRHLLDQQAVERASSCNALVRQLIRARRI